MIGDVAKKLIRELDSHVSENKLGNPFLRSQGYRPYPMNADNFSPIKITESDRRLAFVDGGNLELIGAPNFSIQLNRIYFNIFGGRKRFHPHSLPGRIEFLSLTFAEFKNDEIFYETTPFPLREDLPEVFPLPSDLSFSSIDRRLTFGSSRANIGYVASAARGFAEWIYSEQVAHTELREGDVLVMDGILRTRLPNESKYAIRSYETARKKGVVYTGLSKTSRLFTTTGLSLLGAIRKLALDNKVGPLWYYYPIAYSLSKEHQAEIFIIKLNEQTQRVFRYEIQATQSESLSLQDKNEIFSQLSANASDLTFPGYPYGLIDADDNARVKYEELEQYRVMLLSEISKLGESAKFLRHMQSMDAHDALNLIKEVSYS